VQALAAPANGAATSTGRQTRSNWAPNVVASDGSRTAKSMPITSVKNTIGSRPGFSSSTRRKPVRKLSHEYAVSATDERIAPACGASVPAVRRRTPSKRTSPVSVSTNACRSAYGGRPVTPPMPRAESATTGSSRTSM